MNEGNGRNTLHSSLRVNERARERAREREREGERERERAGQGIDVAAAAALPSDIGPDGLPRRRRPQRGGERLSVAHPPGHSVNGRSDD